MPTTDPPAPPRFLDDLPRHAELERAREAFARGNYALVHREAARIAGSTAPDEVKRAAADLARRTRPDPLAGWLLGGSVALLVALATWYLTHKHG
jgi:hypothetical protein